jgi:hypothetical protein
MTHIGDEIVRLYHERANSLQVQSGEGLMVSSTVIDIEFGYIVLLTPYSIKRKISVDKLVEESTVWEQEEREKEYLAVAGDRE